MRRAVWRLCAAGPAAATVLSAAVALAGQCGFEHEFTRPDERGTTTVKVFQADPVPALGNRRPLLFITSLKVNTDGTKISYHQQDPRGRRCESDPAAAPCAINDIRNAYNDHMQPVSDFESVRDAGYPLPRTWRVLNTNIIEKDAATGKPCITADGYLVSMTSDVAVDEGFTHLGNCDPSKWIDALTVPAIVLPKNTDSNPSQFAASSVGKRSIVVAFSPSATHRVVSGIVGDFGPVREIGEATVAMNGALNGVPASDQPKHRQDAKDRFQAGRTAILLFPGSEFVLARPIDAARVEAAGKDALEKFGGADKLYGCIRDEIDPNF
jgi:hypothetical protein